MIRTSLFGACCRAALEVRKEDARIKQVQQAQKATATCALANRILAPEVPFEPSADCNGNGDIGLGRGCYLIASDVLFGNDDEAPDADLMLFVTKEPSDAERWTAVRCPSDLGEWLLDNLRWQPSGFDDRESEVAQS